MREDRFYDDTIMESSIFNSSELTPEDIHSLKTTGVWKPDCTVPLERLRLLNVSHWDFEGNIITDGQIMVLDAVAQPVLTLFQDLFNCQFPIAKVRLLDHYQADDNHSMEDNNTSCFNWRMIADGSRPSLHGYGVALDINPVQNPFIQFPEDQPNLATFSPAAGRAYANRLPQRPNKPPREGLVDSILECFFEQGFSEWGGHWDTPIDYQHFQVPRALAEQLIALDPAAAEQKFKAHIAQIRETMII